MSDRRVLLVPKILVAPFLILGVATSVLHAQLTPSAQSDSTTKSTASAAAPPAKTTPRHYQTKLPESASQYYAMLWGVDSFTVRTVESGELIRFSYRVLDPQKAKPLNDKTKEPSLICPRAGAKLVIPSMEKVGKLRQTGTPEAGKVYWMAFSNKGRLVKPGDHVNLVIGGFHAEGLVVQ